MYVQYKVNVSENQVDTLKDAIRLKKGVTLCFPKGGIRGDHVLLLTPAQINRLDNAQVQRKRQQIRLSARQVARNVSYTGGFIGMLASLAARAIPLVAHALPTILSGLTTGLLSGGINKAISGEGGDGLDLHKHDKCYRVQKVKGNGLYLSPHPGFVEGDGLFPKHGEDISDGAGLLMGKNSPMDNSTTSGSVEELKDESNLIIYIIGLILLIIWKVTVMCQVRLYLKHKRLEELVQRL